MGRLSPLLALLCLVASCDFTQFGPLADDASGVALTVPDGYPKPHYGQVVAGWGDTTSMGVAISRVAVSAGANSQVRILPLWNGTGVDLHTPTYIGCPVASDCAMGAGASMIGIPQWGAARVCDVIGAPMGDAVEVHCESDGPELVQEVRGPAGTMFGAALAAVPSGFVVGAPGTASASGALYFVPAAGSPSTITTPLALGPATTGAVAIGSLLASAPLPSGDMLVAATAPGHSTSRVVLLVMHGGVADVRACIDDTHANAAGAIALGDLDGDHVPDLVVGDDAQMLPRRDSVQLYNGRDLPTTTGCGSMPSTTITCPDHLHTSSDFPLGIACTGSGFGGALAIGDVNGDGTGDLVVGARLANVSGTSEAGAVYLMVGPSTTTVDVLLDSSPKEGAHLGASVAVAPSRPTSRSEVIAGAPETNEAIVFLCSGLAGDGPAVGPRCIPAS